MAPRESGRGGGSPLLEALPTENWPALGWLEGDGGLLAAARTVGPGFHSGTNSQGGCSGRGRPFGLAGLATFRFVLEVFIVEEQLFPGCKDEVSAAVNTLQNLVLEFHGELLPSARDPKPWTRVQIATVSRSETERPRRQPQIPLLRHISRGFGPPRASAWLLLVRLRYSQMKVPNQELGKLRAALGTAARPSINPALYVPSCGCACAPALPSRVVSRPA